MFIRFGVRRGCWSALSVFFLCFVAHSDSRPNVLLITIDTLRADRIGSYGDHLAHTPQLDAWSLRTDQALDASTDVPLTLPAHVSLFSNRTIANHRVFNNGMVVPESVPLLAESMKQHGYRTIAVISGYPLVRNTGLHRGFDIYRDHLPLTVEGSRPEQTADTAVQSAISLLESGTDPLFLWVHLYDPHAPYSAPDVFQRSNSDTYRAEVAFTDIWFGRLIRRWLERMGRDSTIVVAGDHGEGLGDHGELTHGVFLYQETIHIPLFIGRGEARCRLIEEPCMIQTAGRWIAQAARLRTEAWMLNAPANLLYSIYPFARYRWSPVSAIRDGNWKYITAPESELYNLETDPREKTNLASRETARCEAFKRRLNGAFRSNDDVQNEIDSRSRDALASLGYIIHTGTPETSAELPNPRLFVSLLEPIEKGLESIQSAQWERAESIFRTVVKVDATNPIANNNLGLALIQQNRADEAVLFLETAARTVPDDSQIQNNLGVALRKSGDLKSAERVLRRAVSLDPSFASAHLNLAGVLHLLNLSKDADESLRQAITLDPTLSESSIAHTIRQSTGLSEGKPPR